MSKKGLKVTGIVALLCLWVFVVMKAVAFVVSIILSFLLGKEQLSQPIWTTIGSTLICIVSVVLIVFIPAKCYKKWQSLPPKKRTPKKKKGDMDLNLSISRTSLGLKGWPTWTDIGLSPLGLVASLVMAAGLVWIFSLFPWFNVDQFQDVGFSPYASGGDRVLAFFTLVVIAPIAEEIIFRGWLYGKIRQLLVFLPEWSGVVISNLVVSVLFGVMHGQWNVGVNVFCLSIVLCALREVTGTIYAGILTHMLRNGLALCLRYILGIG